MALKDATINKLSLLEQVVGSMNEMVCVVDADGLVLYSNAKMEKVIGTKAERSCPGRTGGRGCDICYAKTCIEQGRPQNLIYEMHGRVYNVSLVPIRGDEGDVTGALEVWSDVTGEKRLKERLTAQNELLKSDLKIASTLQQSMLPLEKDIKNGLRFDMMYHPCEDVGGDFYDIFFLDEDYTAFYIADVSGHGVSAAMLTVFFSQAVKSIMYTKKADTSPDEVLSEVWRRFMGIDLQEHLYITAWLGMLNTKTGELKYANAGHIIAPLMYDGMKISKLSGAGFPICRWVTSPSFEQQAITVPKKGRILLYTDGLSDAWRMKEDTDEKPIFRTPDELAESCLKMTDFKEVLESIWQGVRLDEYELKLTDDIAMLALERI